MGDKTPLSLNRSMFSTSGLVSSIERSRSRELGPIGGGGGVGGGTEFIGIGGNDAEGGGGGGIIIPPLEGGGGEGGGGETVPTVMLFVGDGM